MGQKEGTFPCIPPLDFAIAATAPLVSDDVAGMQVSGDQLQGGLHAPRLVQGRGHHPPAHQ